MQYRAQLWMTMPNGRAAVRCAVFFAGRYLTQLLADALKKGAPARNVWTTSPSETNTPDIDFDNLA